MTQEQVEFLINDCINHIKVDAKGLAEARERTAKFLTAHALITNYLKNIEVEIGRHEATVEMAYSQALKETPGKNVTERKSHVIDNQLYREERIKLTELEAIRSWLKTHMKVLENAHIMYRQYSRE